MRDHVRWLHGEMDDWVARRLITADEAKTLRDAYPLGERGKPWGPVVFLGLGAAIVGLGIILLFAYNWQAMPKVAKLGTIFAALAAAHGAGVALLLRRPERRLLAEGPFLLGTMLFGAGIWLVAQVYHIDEHFPNGILLWAAGAVAMAWAIPSVPQGLLACALLVSWAATETLQFDRPIHLAAPLIGVLVLPLAVTRRSRVLLAASVPSLLFITVLNAAALSERFIASTLIALAGTVIAVSVLTQERGRFPKASPVLAACGWIPYLLMLFLITFREIAGDALRVVGLVDRSALELTYLFAPPVLCLAAWGLVAAQISRWSAAERRRACPWDYWLVPLTTGLLLLVQFSWNLLRNEQNVWQGAWLIAGAVNGIFLAQAAGLLVRGAREGRLLPTTVGALLLCALAIARFVDLFESLVARGVAFVVVGAALLAAGVLHHKARKSRREVPP
ncbi:MAG TPA: DUF2157 domain-containing protein [Planctomycetota bacterium]|jgi:uncharacterized membrane protein|nr:DUF2157 domain-containing protein [Planctomycetota bacterium]